MVFCVHSWWKWRYSVLLSTCNVWPPTKRPPRNKTCHSFQLRALRFTHFHPPSSSSSSTMIRSRHNRNGLVVSCHRVQIANIPRLFAKRKCRTCACIVLLWSAGYGAYASISAACIIVIIIIISYAIYTIRNYINGHGWFSGCRVGSGAVARWNSAVSFVTMSIGRMWIFVYYWQSIVQQLQNKTIVSSQYLFTSVTSKLPENSTRATNGRNLCFSGFAPLFLLI